MTDTIPRKLLQDAIDSLEGYRRELRDVQPCDTEKELKAALAAPEPQPVKQTNDWEIRGKLTALKCWHRLTEAEADDLVSFFSAQPVKQAPQYCGTSHCSCIECVMEKKP